MSARADTSKYFRWACGAFLFFWAMQWAFGVREADANEIAKWVIGTGKVLAMLVTLGLAIRLLYQRLAERNTDSGK